MRFEMWRMCFLAGGVLIAVGGPRHPGGSMLEMLTHPSWFMAHALVLLGFGALLTGLLLFARSESNTRALRRWTTLAIAGTGLMTLEMAVHTAAMVDAQHLAAGHSTPVLSTHLLMSLLFYPIFGVTSALFMIAAARQRAIGAPLFVWIGVIGTLANGAAPILVLGFDWIEARILFRFVMGVSLWMVLSALWPARRAARAVTAPTAA